MQVTPILYSVLVTALGLGCGEEKRNDDQCRWPTAALTAPWVAMDLPDLGEGHVHVSSPDFLHVHWPRETDAFRRYRAHLLALGWRVEADDTEGRRDRASAFLLDPEGRTRLVLSTISIDDTSLYVNLDCVRAYATPPCPPATNLDP
jgi:hypothetical protein